MIVCATCCLADPTTTWKMFTHNHLFNISTRDRPSLQDLNVNPENIDPSRDWEAWTRFRIAVNDRLCENIKQRSALNQSEDFSFSINSYVAEEVRQFVIILSRQKNKTLMFKGTLRNACLTSYIQ